MREIGIGIIGYGFMGKAHTYGYLNMPLYYDNLPFNPKLVGVCNHNIAKAEDARDRVGFGFATADYRELLACPEIDAVHVCTPNSSHLPMVLDAIQAGKHVYVDKPLAMNASDAKTMCEAAKGTGLTCQVAFHNRFFVSSMRAKEIMDSGAIGQITAFRAKYLIASNVNPHKASGWRNDQGLSGGGVLLDLGSHTLDLLLWLMGKKPEAILCSTSTLHPTGKDAQGREIPILVEDHSVMMLRLEGGAVGTVEASKVCTGMDDELCVEIHGTKGALILNLTENDQVRFYDNTLPDEPLGGNKGFTAIRSSQRYNRPGGEFPSPKQSIGWLRAHAHCVYTFLESVYHAKEGSPSLEDGYKIQQVMDAAYLSKRSNQWEQIF